MSFFQVIVPPLDQPLTYKVPGAESIQARVGQRVLVPLKRKLVTGYLWEKVLEPEEGPEIKAISQILDPAPLFTEAMRPFFVWISQYYLYPLGQVLKTALPPGLAVASQERVEITPLGKMVLEKERLPEKVKGLLLHLVARGRLLIRFSPEEKKNLDLLKARGWIRQATVLKKEATRLKKERWIYPGAQFEKGLLVEKEVPLFDLLASQPGLALKEVREKIPLSSRRLSVLCGKGLIEIREQVCQRNPLGEVLTLEDGCFELTGEQQEALTRIEEGLQSQKYETILLHGITGSGKTEVYLRAAAEALKQGRQVLIMVPEIGLVPQMEGRFRLRFGDRIALLHSGLSPGERFQEWRRLQAGSAPVVIGTRSAIFAPLKSLGLIVVDEEHDPSYKQGDSLRYNARDLALVRGQQVSAVVVLGSATPSISTLYLRKQKKVSYLGIQKRVQDQPLPEIHLVDMKKVHRGRKVPLLSPPLAEAMSRNLEQGQQTLLFLNRRGFDTLILCTLCGAVIKCRNCSLTLTYHAKEGLLMCHTCGYRLRMPDLCPVCQQKGIKALGMGTEKVEQELAGLFPQAAIDRMDRDTVTRKRAHFEILKRLRDRKTDILIGTQMITKGHDFRHVTLIGVLSADLSLNWPDFRGGERTFQLLAQVAGRAGRGTDPGRVFIQTYNPDHYIFDYVCRHDYLGFYDQEIHLRRDLKYPPFGRLTNVLFQGNQEANVKEVAENAGKILIKAMDKNQWGRSLEVLGPVPAPIARIKGRYRWQLLLKGDNSRLVHQATAVVQQAQRALTLGTGVQIVLDVDPVDMI